jgi:hypothetical protein
VVEREAVAGRRWCFGYRCFALRFVTFLISWHNPVRSGLIGTSAGIVR